MRIYNHSGLNLKFKIAQHQSSIIKMMKLIIVDWNHAVTKKENKDLTLKQNIYKEISTKIADFENTKLKAKVLQSYSLIYIDLLFATTIPYLTLSSPPKTTVTLSNSEGD